MYNRKELDRKEVDDVLGGEGAWDNVDQTTAQCPVEACDGSRAYFFQLQIRSADEPMTTFYKVSTVILNTRWSLLTIIVCNLRPSMERKLVRLKKLN